MHPKAFGVSCVHLGFLEVAVLSELDMFPNAHLVFQIVVNHEGENYTSHPANLCYPVYVDK